MKPMGRIPAGFGCVDGKLTIGGIDCNTLIARAGGETPLFVYDFALVQARVQALRAALPSGVALHYAMKANPLPTLVSAISGIVDGIDVASGGELQVALNCGATHISFAGPGKRAVEIEAAIRAGVTLNLESENEAARALSIAKTLGLRPRLAVRVNPDFDLKGSGMRMGGGAKPFGVDAVRVPALVSTLLAEGADWQGFHIFAGSQALDANAIAETQANTVALAASLAAEIGVCPPLVNLGGGFGIPYFPNDVTLDIDEVGNRLGETLSGRPQILQDSRFAIELGRYIVGEAGVYLTRVIDRKVSYGEVFLVTDGGMHHQLAASGNFGTVVKRNYPAAVATRFDAGIEETASIVGCLCTPLDRLGDQVGLPKADAGDVIAIFMAGAYGATASPANFLGHGPARELLVNAS